MKSIKESYELKIENPQLKAIADDMALQIGLSMDKVVLNHFDKIKYPQPKERSFETLLEKLFIALPDSKKKKARLKTLKRLETRQKGLGGLDKIDLSSKKPISDQAKSLNRKLPQLTGDELLTEQKLTFSHKLIRAEPKELLTPKINLKGKLKPIKLTPNFGIKTPELQTPKQSQVKDGPITGWYKKQVNPRTDLGNPTGSFSGEYQLPNGEGNYKRFDKGTLYWSKKTGLQIVEGAIRERYEKIGGSSSPLGLPVSGEERLSKYNGRLQRFEQGAIYWSSKTGAFESFGDIRRKWGQLKWENGLLGYPISGEIPLENDGRIQKFEGGNICWSAGSGAQEIYGAIGEKWKALDAEKGILGYPTSGELDLRRKNGRYQKFQGGAIYWKPKSGAHEIHGAIKEKWDEHGKEEGIIGIPITGEIPLNKYDGRLQRFENGSIYWSYKSGAHKIHGPILEKWGTLNWENGKLGYPLTDESEDKNGRFCRFEGGEIRYNKTTGAYLAAPHTTTLVLRCARLKCIEDTSEVTSDEMAMGGSVFKIGLSGSDEGKKFGLIGLEDNWDDGDWNAWKTPRRLVGVNISGGDWPKLIMATCFLVERDSGSYSGVLNDIMAKLIPLVKEKVELLIDEAARDAGVAIGGPAGAVIGMAVGYLANKLAAYIIDKLAEWVTDLWTDDVFPPRTLMIEIPAFGALFEGDQYVSPTTAFTIHGNGGRYRVYFDWKLF